MRSRGEIRHRRELRPDAGERHGDDLHFVDTFIRCGQHLDVGDPGNRMRRTYGDEQAIRPGATVEKHVRTADVRRRGLCL